VAALAPRELHGAIEREAPKRLELPSLSSKPIDYRGPGGPFVEARVQELFGLDEHPRVCGESLVLRLLDPGGKPLQVTSDLPGFWRGSWAEARKQLRGRYPKHEWPEDPAVAAPSRSGIKKRER
jgi:ATP-dependent helicase HrpB